MKPGQVIIPSNCFPREHEMATIKTLANAGIDIEVLPPSTKQQEKSPDIRISGSNWEMKAPKSSKLAAIERNLKKASKQSRNIIFDTRRMSYVPDFAIERELKKHAQKSKIIKRLIMIDKKQKIIDIK